MKKFIFLFILLLFSNNVLAESKWITKKKDSKISKVKSLEQMYVDGLLTRSECIKAKKKILKNQSIPGCKKVETEEEKATYIKKKEKKKEEKKLITKKKANKLEEQLNKIERLTPGDYYLFAHSTSGEKFWGSTKAKNRTTQVGNATSSNGYTCELISKVTRNKPPYKGSFKLDCSSEVINGSWTQDCKQCNGIGQAFTRSGDVITAFFSKSQSETVEVVKSYFGSGSTQIAKKEKKEKKVAKKKIKKYKPKETEEDTIKPTIEIASTVTFKNPDYVLTGKVADKGGSEAFYLFYKVSGGKERRVKLKNGKFEIPRFSYGEEIEFIARDEYRNEATKNVKVIVVEEETEIAKVYDKPKPILKGQKNNKRVAIIIGVEEYENTPVKALYAKNDAQEFKNFARRSLGVSSSNIKVLIDTEAKRLDAISVLKKWLPKKITAPNQFELFVFFSGHGYPSEEQELHLIPQDGDPTLLEESALSHKKIIKLIQKTKPKSVTMFIDACYSGQSRTDEVLVAGLKPLSAVEINEDTPSNFTIFSSSKSNQVSATIKEAEHGIFSYYLMKGLSGEADEDQDRKITNKELYTYLKDTVSQEAFIQNREQDPILTSENPDQILIKY